MVPLNEQSVAPFSAERSASTRFSLKKEQYKFHWKSRITQRLWTADAVCSSWSRTTFLKQKFQKNKNWKLLTILDLEANEMVREIFYFSEWQFINWLTSRRHWILFLKGFRFPKISNIPITWASLLSNSWIFCCDDRSRSVSLLDSWKWK